MFGPIIAKPGSSRKNKTGSWRTESKPKFLQKNCIACRLCVLICPEGCIEGKEKNTFHSIMIIARVAAIVQLSVRSRILR